MSDRYDLVIIGAGSAGLTAASFGTQFGARVALVERDRMGGDCTWSGCVPSKTLLKVAKVAHQTRTADRYGLDANSPRTDLARVMAHVREVIASIYEEESPEALRNEGIDVYLGDPRFLDSHTVTVNGTELAARHFLIATGAHPYIPAVSGLDGVPYLTYESIWDLDQLPDHLVVVGGGPIGCEMAQAFCRLGSRVTLLASRDRLLPRDDPSASAVLEDALVDEGVDVRTSSRAERVWRDDAGIHLLAGDTTVTGSPLLLAVGRRPNVDGLDLARADVTYSSRGIQVNERLQTSQAHIYAAGDCTGGPQFTHYAGWQAAMAVRNALLPGASRAVSDIVPWTTFTDPEVAHVGATQARAREQFGDDVMTCDWPMSRVDRARIDGSTIGFLKLVHRRNGDLLGATIVSERAGEMIHEWTLALNHGLKVGDVSQDIHVYPTYSTASMQSSASIRMDLLLSGTSGRAIRALTHLVR